MAVRVQEMTGEELLLAKTFGEAACWEQVDQELDRRALTGPPARQIVARSSRKFVRARPISSQLVA